MHPTKIRNFDPISPKSVNSYRSRTGLQSKAILRWRKESDLKDLSRMSRQSLNDLHMARLQKKWSNLYTTNVYLLNRVSNSHSLIFVADRKHLSSNIGSSSGLVE